MKHSVTDNNLVGKLIWFTCSGPIALAREVKARTQGRNLEAETAEERCFLAC